MIWLRTGMGRGRNPGSKCRPEITCLKSESSHVRDSLKSRRRSLTWFCNWFNVKRFRWNGEVQACVGRVSTNEKLGEEGERLEGIDRVCWCRWGSLQGTACFCSLKAEWYAEWQETHTNTHTRRNSTWHMRHWSDTESNPMTARRQQTSTHAHTHTLTVHTGTQDMSLCDHSDASSSLKQSVVPSELSVWSRQTDRAHVCFSVFSNLSRALNRHSSRSCHYPLCMSMSACLLALPDRFYQFYL